MHSISTVIDSFKKFILKDRWFFLLLVLIGIVAIFLRFYNFDERIFVQADNSRDAQVAVYAAHNFFFPIIGQFSSAGPFFYGPWYYWFLQIFNLLPFGILTSWFVIKVVYLAYIALIYLLGKEIGGKKLGALCALFAAVSPAQINYSFSIWNPAIVPILVLTTLLILLGFYKRKTLLNFFLLNFLVSLSLSVHFQSILILPVLLVALILIKPAVINYIKYLLVAVVGFLIPLLPLIYFDLRFDGYNSKSILVYLLVDQYNIWIPNRWLTYVFSYWPETWSYIVGGYSFVVYVLIAVLIPIFIWNLRKFNKNRHFYLIALVFLFEFIMFRYYRGERYQYYSLFAHSPIIIITAWTCWKLSRLHKLVGGLLIFTVVFFSLLKSIEDFKERGVTLAEVDTSKELIYGTFKNKKFDIYGCKSNASSVSHPLALSMYFDGMNDVNGVKIGVCEDETGIAWTALTNEDLGGKEPLWYGKSTKTVYIDTVEWWKIKPPLGGDDDLWRFLYKAIFKEG